MKAEDAFREILKLLNRFDEAKIPFTLGRLRDDALLIEAHAPGEHWEIEFVDYGDEVRVDIERYVSDGHIDDESILKRLFALWADEETPSEEMPVKHEPVSTN
jgi:hypothetical protein